LKITSYTFFSNFSSSHYFNCSILASLGRTLLNSAEFIDALDAFDRVSSLLEKAEHGTNNFEAHLGKAEYYIHVGKYSKARSVLQTVNEQNLQHGMLTWLLILRGKLELHLGFFSKALRHFYDALNIYNDRLYWVSMKKQLGPSSLQVVCHPRSAFVVHFIGIVYWYEEKWDRAFLAFSAAADIFQSCNSFHVCLSRCMYFIVNTIQCLRPDDQGLVPSTITQRDRLRITKSGEVILENDIWAEQKSSSDLLHVMGRQSIRSIGDILGFTHPE
jgi:tetratricopeptide (TPR) repeat protein